jgi:hypothetical protein
MSGPSRRAAARERQACEILGIKRRTYRPRYESASDSEEPVRLACGVTLLPEVKTRAELPKWFTGALEQARRYLPGATPLFVVSETGGEPLAVLPLRDFARIAGLKRFLENEQLVIGKVE